VTVELGAVEGSVVVDEVLLLGIVESLLLGNVASLLLGNVASPLLLLLADEEELLPPGKKIRNSNILRVAIPHPEHLRHRRRLYRAAA